MSVFQFDDTAQMELWVMNYSIEFNYVYVNKPVSYAKSNHVCPGETITREEQQEEEHLDTCFSGMWTSLFPSHVHGESMHVLSASKIVPIVSVNVTDACDMQMIKICGSFYFWFLYPLFMLWHLSTDLLYPGCTRSLLSGKHNFLPVFTLPDGVNEYSKHDIYLSQFLQTLCSVRFIGIDAARCNVKLLDLHTPVLSCF